MARPRPTSVTVMGILNIIFGSLFLLCYLCNGVSLIMQSSNRGGGFGGANDPGVELMNQMQAEIPGFMAYQVGSSLLHLTLSILLLTSGIGLLNMANWARILCIFYAILTILSQIGALIFQLAYVNPAMNRWQQEFIARQGAAGRMGAADPTGNVAMSNVQSVGGAVIGMIYAIVLLVIMLLPSVSAAFAGRSVYRDDDRERYEDDDEDLGRERRRRDEYE